MTPTPTPQTKPDFDFELDLGPEEESRLYDNNDGQIALHLHPGQSAAWESRKRFIFIIAGSQSGKTSFGPWWLWREIDLRGAGDYIAATSNYDLFKLKMLPEIRYIFEDVLGIGRYWAGDRVIEIMDPERGEFWAKKSDDPMWARVILRSAAAKGGLESSTAKGAWLDECGQPEFTLDAWEAVRRRLSLARGRVLGTTTPYDLGWLKTHIVDKWKDGDPTIEVIRFSSLMNPAFPRDEYYDVKTKMVPWKFNMMYRGIFSRPAGMIYADYVDRYREFGGHKVKPFDVPTRWPRFVGVDPGAVNVGQSWLAYDPDEDVYYLFREHLEGGKSTREHVEKALKRAEKDATRIEGWFVGASAEVQQRTDWEDFGAFPVYEPPFKDVEAGIDKVIELFRTRRLFIFDNCTGTRGEIETYSRELDDNNVPTEKIKDKNKYHHLDALRYAVVGATYREEPVLWHQAMVKGRQAR